MFETLSVNQCLQRFARQVNGDYWSGSGLDWFSDNDGMVRVHTPAGEVFVRFDNFSRSEGSAIFHIFGAVTHADEIKLNMEPANVLRRGLGGLLKGSMTSGDVDIDGKYVIRCEQESQARRILQQEDLRQALKGSEAYFVRLATMPGEENRCLAEVWTNKPPFVEQGALTVPEENYNPRRATEMLVLCAALMQAAANQVE